MIEKSEHNIKKIVNFFKMGREMWSFYQLTTKPAVGTIGNWSTLE